MLLTNNLFNFTETLCSEAPMSKCQRWIADHPGPQHQTMRYNLGLFWFSSTDRHGTVAKPQLQNRNKFNSVDVAPNLGAIRVV